MMEVSNLMCNKLEGSSHRRSQSVCNAEKGLNPRRSAKTTPPVAKAQAKHTVTEM